MEIPRIYFIRSEANNSGIQFDYAALSIVLNKKPVF